MPSHKRPVFSFVLPAYNESESCAEMAGRLIAVGEQLDGSFEIVWVNDGSTDNTGKVLDQLAREDKRIRPIHLSRNFGHMAALTAGLDCSEATGAVICLDSDGQHPPELIPELVKQWRAGADIVQTLRDANDSSARLTRLTSRLFYGVLNVLTDVHVPAGGADFRLMDRQVVDALSSLPERVRFVRGLVHWVGFSRNEVHYTASPRVGGTSKYGKLAMMKLALGGITSLSHRPLRLAFLVGVFVILCAIIYALYVLWCAATGVPLVPGWTSTLLVVLVLGGVQLLTLGIASEYLGRIYFETKHRPLYFIRKDNQGSSRER